MKKIIKLFINDLIQRKIKVKNLRKKDEDLNMMVMDTLYTSLIIVIEIIIDSDFLVTGC